MELNQNQGTPEGANKPSRLKGVLAWFGRVMMILFLVLSFTVIFEESFIYFPTRYPQGDWDAPKHYGVPVEDVELRTKDGVTIHGWFFPNESAETTILFFHGNAGNLSDRFGWMAMLTQLPAKVLIVDYRGYGKSEGKPSEEGLYLDAEAAYDWLVGTKGTKPETLLIYGNSLGGAPAAELALRKAARGLIMQSTFTSAPDMAARMFPFLPVKSLVRSQFNNLEKVRKIQIPKLFVHGSEDDLVPTSMGRELHKYAAEPKAWLELPGAGHNDTTSRYGNKILEGIRAMVQEGVKP